MKRKTSFPFVFPSFIRNFARNNIKNMQTIDEFREAIVQALLNKKDDDGLGIIMEKHARQLVGQLTDDELDDGIDFNTPEEIAEWLLEE